MNAKTAPKYIELKNAILADIQQGVYKEGDLLPSERELIEIFNVSRITVRRALDELEREDFVYRVKGKGSIVKFPDRKQDLFALTSCTQDIIRLGMTPSRKVIRQIIQTTTDETRNELKLSPNDTLYTLERVYLADGEPVNLTTTNIPYKYVPGIEKYDFSQVSLYEVLESRYTIEIIRSTRSISAVIAPDEVYEHLQCKLKDPLLLFNCVVFGKVGGKEVPIESFVCYYRSDKFGFYINQVR